MSVQFQNNTVEVNAKVLQGSDLALGLMAAGIETQIKTSGNTPFLPKSTKWAQRGALRTNTRSIKNGIGNYSVEMLEPYAAAQEAGTNPHPIKNYSTPGTGKGFFRKAIDTTMARSAEYISTGMNAVGMDKS